jgi:cellobiose phosphorylase
VCTGVRSIVLDGEKTEGNMVPAFTDGQTHRVEVTMG